MPADRTAILLIAHGSRRPSANADLVTLAERLDATGRYDLVEVAYLELAEPSIPAGARRCVERGATRVIFSPFFLSAGNHVTQDLERYRNESAHEFPDVEFRLAAPLGLHPKILEIVIDRIGEELGKD